MYHTEPIPKISMNNGQIFYAYNVLAQHMNSSIPVTSNANGVFTINTHAGNFNHQLAFISNGGIYYRYFDGLEFDNESKWFKVITAEDITISSDGSYIINLD